MTHRILTIAVAVALLANVALAAEGFLTSNAHAQAAESRIEFSGQARDDLRDMSEASAELFNTTQNLDKLIRQGSVLATNSAPDQKAAIEARLKLLDAILVSLRR